MIVRALPDFSLASYNFAKDKAAPLNDGLFYLNSGSNAIKFFLSLFGTSKRVGIQVFTCSTVKDAISSVGDIPVYMETNQEFFTTTLEIVLQYIDSIDILILSHICGIPNPDYIKIKELCKKKHKILLDDLCQTFHACVNGTLLEDLSDNYVYSFFYDKPISAARGGALKMDPQYEQIAQEKFLLLKKETENVGISRLNQLYWMSRLLQPSVYTKDFRTWCGWETWIMGIYPKSWPVKVLKFLVNPSVSLRVSKIFLNKESVSSIQRMSDIQIKYIQAQMILFEKNNHILKDMLSHFACPVPKYLSDERIECSIAKRAIVTSIIKVKMREINIELSLYNWSELIDNEGNYKSSSILSDYVNVPTSTRWFDQYK